MKNKFFFEEKKILEKKLKSICLKLIKEDSNDLSNSYRNEFNNLIIDNLDNSDNITYILHYISKEIINNEKFESKIKILILLEKFYNPFKSLNNESDNFSIIFHLYCKYTSQILTILQKMISLNIPPNFISEIFGKIISILFSKNVVKEKDIKKLKKTFEIIQGFCFYNIKQHLYINQINGVLCLKELISRIEYYIHNKKIIQNIFEKIMLFLDNDNFEPKKELFEILSVFIKKCGKLFEPYINITFYKLLNFIEINDAIIKRKVIDVLYIVLLDFSYEFISISNSIINYLKLLIKKNNDIYIINKCQNVLSFYNNLNFYSTYYNYNNSIDNNFNLLKINKSSFSKTTIKKNDSLASKSTKYTSSKKHIKNMKESINKLNIIKNKTVSKIFNNHNYYKTFNKEHNYIKLSKTFYPNFISRNSNVENKNNNLYKFLNSSFNKSAKRFKKYNI